MSENTRGKRKLVGCIWEWLTCCLWYLCSKDYRRRLLWNATAQALYRSLHFQGPDTEVWCGGDSIPVSEYYQNEMCRKKIDKDLIEGGPFWHPVCVATV